MLTQVIEALASDPRTAELLTRELPPVLVRGGPGSRRLSAFFLTPGGDEPAMFVKLALDPTDRLGLEREQATLALLAELSDLRGSVPRPVALLESPAGLLGVQGGVGGSTVAADLRRRWRRHAVAADVGPVLAWLDRFQAATRTGERSALDAVAFERRLHAETGGDPAFTDPWAVHVERVARLLVPNVRRHGDFWPRNVLVRGDDVCVVDWEHSVADGTPTHDLFMFLTSHSALLPPRPFSWHSTTDGFVSAFLAPGRRRDQYTGVAKEFLVRQGFPATDLPVLLVDFLLAMIESPPFGEADDWRAMLRECLERGERL